MTLDYSKIGDVKCIYSLTDSLTDQQYVFKALWSVLINPNFSSMDLNITIWFSSDDILKALDTMEKWYEGCYTKQINIMKDKVVENYDSEWVIECGF